MSLFKTISLLSLALFSTLVTISQTSEQAKGFINKSNIAVCKVQKEMIRASETTSAADFKQAIQFQAAAVKSYKAGNLQEAVEYSYNSRLQSITLLENLSKSSAEYFKLNEEEKLFFNPKENAKLLSKNNLTDNEKNKIDELDILNAQKLKEIELSIN